MAKNISAVYDDACVELDTEGSLESARVVVPILLSLVNPKSVIEFGCARGAWLKAFHENGVKFVHGLDGPWVDQSKLLIDKNDFQTVDLRQPYDASRQVDLAVCLEVAEHLPPKAGAPLIRALTMSAPLVLFSAAVPGQTGTGHINEQWPSYWKPLFEKQGFRRLDPIRRHIWQDNRVQWWYRQNIFLYASEDAVANSEALRVEQELTASIQDEWIHMRIHSRYPSLRDVLRELPRAAWRSVKHRLMGDD